MHQCRLPKTKVQRRETINVFISMQRTALRQLLQRRLFAYIRSRLSVPLSANKWRPRVSHCESSVDSSTSSTSQTLCVPLLVSEGLTIITLRVFHNDVNGAHYAYDGEGRSFSFTYFTFKKLSLASFNFGRYKSNTHYIFCKLCTLSINVSVDMLCDSCLQSAHIYFYHQHSPQIYL